MSNTTDNFSPSGKHFKLSKTGHKCPANPSNELLREAKNGDSARVEFILKNCNGIDVNAEDYNGWSAFQHATTHGHLEVIRLLLQEKSFDMESALVWASKKGHAETLKLLLDIGGIDINMDSGYWNGDKQVVETPLILAMQPESSLEVFQLLLEQDAIEVNKGNPLFEASAYEHPKVVQLLLQRRDTDVNQEGRNPWHGCSGYCNNIMTPLEIASKRGNTEIVQLLLEHPRTDIERIYHRCNYVENDQCPKNYTIEMKIASAMDDGSTTISDSKVELLVQSILGNERNVSDKLQNNDVLVNTHDSYGRTLMFWAATRNHIDLLVTLLNKNNTNILVNHGRSIDDATALYKASEYGHQRVVRLLLNHPKTDANCHTLDKKTPLMIASFYGEAVVVEMLLSVVNINVNSATFDGKTALIYAASAKQSNSLELLLRCPKTDAGLVDAEYKTALDRSNGFKSQRIN